MNDIIYLDYAASTPVDPTVVEKMHDYLSFPGAFANPASLHAGGQKARAAIELARAQVADLIKADPEEIIWTSGATEAINLAIKGAARLYQRRGRHIVTQQTEHRAVLDACQHLEKDGFEVTYLPPNAYGIVEPDTFVSALRPDTVLATIMHVNNELGAINDIATIAKITAAHHILLHVDAAQSVGKIAINLQDIPIDLLSLSAHKIYGPKGIGALYLRKKPRVRVEPLIHGGGQEQGMRSGTLPTHQIVGMGAAFALAQIQMHHDREKMAQLRQQFLSGLQSLPYFACNTALENSIPHIVNIRFEGRIADEYLKQLPIAASTGSACLNHSQSHVLRAIGLNEQQIKSSIRFSFGRPTTAADVAAVVEMLRQF